MMEYNSIDMAAHRTTGCGIMDLVATLPDPEDDSWDWGATPESQRQMDDAQVTRALFCGVSTLTPV